LAHITVAKKISSQHLVLDSTAEEPSLRLFNFHLQNPHAPPLWPDKLIH
jgi:hypothetical protein